MVNSKKAILGPAFMAVALVVFLIVIALVIWWAKKSLHGLF